MSEALVLLVVLLLTYILLLFSDAILRIIGRQGAAILVRLPHSRWNGAFGKGDIEGKTARVAASELGKERVSNRADDIGSGKLGARPALEFVTYMKPVPVRAFFYFFKSAAVCDH